MIDRGKRSVLGVDVSVVDYDGAVDKIMRAAAEKRPLAVSALAVHGVMTGALDPDHKYRLNRLDVVTPDGQPVRWALRLLHGERLPDRVYGPRLTELVLSRAAQERIPVYLYGSQPKVLADMRATFATRYPDLLIAGAERSKFRQLAEDEHLELQDRIRSSGAGIVLVGLGCPRQEVFVYEHAKAVGLPMMAVGAAFDFHAGTLKQAPTWMQDRGLEWVFRLAIEPRRLWRRYLFLNPLYVAMIVGQSLGLIQSRLDKEQEPEATIRYG